MIKRIQILSIFAMLSMLMACEKDEPQSYDCWQELRFESSAVCSSSIDDASLSDGNGNFYIARDFFQHIDRMNVTVGQIYKADYRSIDQVSDLTTCGDLIEAPFVELLCIRLAD